MELFSSPLLLLGALVSLIVGHIIYSYIYKPYYHFKKLGIPGPFPKPLIGNLDLLRRMDMNVLKFTEYLFNTYGSTCGMFLGSKQFLLTKDIDLLKQITIKHSDNFVDRLKGRGLIVTRVDGKIQKGINSLLGDEWKEKRRILSPAFSALKVKQMEPLVRESVSRLGKKISSYANNGESIEIQNMFSQMTIEVILSTAFGRAVDVQNGKGGELYESAMIVFGSLSAGVKQISKITKLLNIGSFLFPRISPFFDWLISFTRLGEASRYLVDVSKEMIKTKRMDSGDKERKDLLSMMIVACDEESKKTLTTGEIISNAVTFLLAGYETTSSTLVFTVGLLAAHPHIQDKLAEEIGTYFNENPNSSMYDATHSIEYLDMVLSEAMRMYPVGPVTFRMCDETIKLNGITIQKGVTVLVPLYDVHHDPEIWSDPETFDPERFSPENKAKVHPCAFMPFGVGPRNCIGMRLALLEAKMALIEVVSKYKFVLDPKTKLPFELSVGATLKAKGGLSVTFQARS